ncbi:hypothetical protein [Myroides marinus]|uniref:Uncharacterized protein n=1 Tax=Myroides marinus TaxID=703342 RepID=A0A1H6TH13_9FLAO|nr:hypothetical protein [Myroides marinus]MDM1378971.1 hypothetical protein [Myroides marinus]MDM1386242.1 hypothetical protein [Myroides marinus]MDM1393455.1 hypothetical protein [Myroides marinus]SEI75570.1 hypothetical protein SAMN04488018_10439 [Myroides marinus]
MKSLKTSLWVKILSCILLFISGIDLYYTIDNHKTENILNDESFSPKLFYNKIKRSRQPISIKPWVNLGNYKIQERKTKTIFSNEKLVYKLYFILEDQNGKNVKQQDINFPKLTTSDNINISFMKDDDGNYLTFDTELLSKKYLVVNDGVNTPLHIRLNPFDLTTKLILAIAIIILGLLYYYIPKNKTTYNGLLFFMIIPFVFIPQYLLVITALSFILLTTINRIKIKIIAPSVGKYTVSKIILMLVLFGVLIPYFVQLDRDGITILAIFKAGAYALFSLLVLYVIFYILKNTLVCLKLILWYKGHPIYSLVGENMIHKPGKNESFKTDLIINETVRLKKIDVAECVYKDLQDYKLDYISKYKTDGKGNYVFY